MRAFDAMKVVANEFLDGSKTNKTQSQVDEMMAAFEEIGVKMTIKLHFLKCHLDQFPESPGRMGDQQGEKLHQRMTPFDKR